MKLIEWNINKRSNNIQSRPFVATRLMEQKADVICLVEYIHDVGLIAAMEEEYWLEESIISSGNQVLIAVSKKYAPFGIEVVRNEEEQQCFNLLHVRFNNISGNEFSIIGIRMLTGEGKYAINARKQTPPLNRYLSAVKDPFVCVGDFNIREQRMKYWFPEYRIGSIRRKKNELSSTSFIFSGINWNKRCGILDHVLLHPKFSAEIEYYWDFIRDDTIYPQEKQLKEGASWCVRPGYPDHAMMICDIDI